MIIIYDMIDCMGFTKCVSNKKEEDMDGTYADIQNYVDLEAGFAVKTNGSKMNKHNVCKGDKEHLIDQTEHCLCRKSTVIDWAFMSSNRYNWWRSVLHMHAKRQPQEKIACSWVSLQSDDCSTNGLPVSAAQLETATSAWCWLQEWAQRNNAMHNTTKTPHKTGRKQGWQCWEWHDFAQDLLETLEESHLVCLRWHMVGKRVPNTQFAVEHFVLSESGAGTETVSQQPVQIVALPDDLLPQYVTVVWLFFDARQGSLRTKVNGEQTDARQLLVDRRFLHASEAMEQCRKIGNVLHETKQVAEQIDIEMYKKLYAQVQIQETQKTNVRG